MWSQPFTYLLTYLINYARSLSKNKKTNKPSFLSVSICSRNPSKRAPNPSPKPQINTYFTTSFNITTYPSPKNYAMHFFSFIYFCLKVWFFFNFDLLIFVNFGYLIRFFFCFVCVWLASLLDRRPPQQHGSRTTAAPPLPFLSLLAVNCSGTKRYYKDVLFYHFGFIHFLGLVYSKTLLIKSKRYYKDVLHVICESKAVNYSMPNVFEPRYKQRDILEIFV